MKTVIDQSSEIYKILKGISALSYALTPGGIYKGVRPVNSVTDDVVVNSIVLTKGSLQRGVSNVNIHVKDLQQGPANAPFFVPHEIRLKTLTDIIEPVLNDYYGQDFSLYIDSTSLIREPEINQHYMNLRINFIYENPEENI